MTVGRRPRVAIVGAGFGGLWALRALARAPVDVVLVDRANYHTFLPLLYQVAAAEIEPESIAYPIRSLVRRQANADFVLAWVTDIDWAGHRLHTDGPEIPYDYLVLAIGSAAHFFGVPGAAEWALPLRTMDQAITLRNHILTCFEQAAYAPGAERRRQLLTFIIVGGGPTGVEFAGALAELVSGPLCRDFPGLTPGDVRLVLVEAAGHLLSVLPQRLRDYTARRLQRMGVEVRLQAAVAEVSAAGVRLGDGTAIASATVVWTAGVQGVPQARDWGLPAGRGGRVSILPTLQVADRPEVYVVGDLAHLEHEGQPLPMVAPVAMQQGTRAGQNIARQVAGAAPLTFRYRDRGTLATIGRNAAVAHMYGLSFTGFPAWALWVGVHLFKLIGFRNRLEVMVNWAWDYLFFERVVRLILPTYVGRPKKGG